MVSYLSEQHYKKNLALLARRHRKSGGLVEKTRRQKKNGTKNHLSPSRRRALPREIVQRPALVQASPGAGPARAAWGTRPLHTVQRFEGVCSVMQAGASTKCPHRQQIWNPYIPIYPAKTAPCWFFPMTTCRNVGLVISRSRVRFLCRHHTQYQKKAHRKVGLFLFSLSRPE